MIKVGDHFIYKSKYGGITEGIIGKIIEHKNYDIDIDYIVRKFTFYSTNNVPYKQHEIEFIDRKMTEQDKELYKKAIITKNKLDMRIQTKKAKMEELIKKYINESNKQGS